MVSNNPPHIELIKLDKEDWERVPNIVYLAI